MTDFIKISDEKYPENLKYIKKPPKKLFYKGDINLLNSNCFAVIGSRDLTEYGRYIEKKFVSYLAQKNITIVSRIGNRR